MANYSQKEQDQIQEAYDAIGDAVNGMPPFAILEATSALVGEVLASCFDERDVSKNKSIAMIVERIDGAYAMFRAEEKGDLQ